MTFEESIPLAKQLAENQLKKGFDVEAFLILSEISKMSIKEDLIPESDVDETLTDITGLFEQYFYNRSISNLNILLITVRKMISELYHTCTEEEEKALFKQFIQDMQNIAN